MKLGRFSKIHSYVFVIISIPVTHGKLCGSAKPRIFCSSSGYNEGGILLTKGEHLLKTVNFSLNLRLKRTALKIPLHLPQGRVLVHNSERPKVFSETEKGASVHHTRTFPFILP